MMKKLKLAVLLLSLSLAGLSEAATIPLQDVTVEFSFTDNSNAPYDSEDGFYVYRCAGVGCAPTTVIMSLPANTTKFMDTIMGDVGGASYTYGVSAFNKTGESGKATLVVVTPAILVVPSAPTGIVATVVGVVIK